ncbi:hypothetical protein DQ04_00741030 [Trypanosoma grayi]|uniref:hypothetical protein n=1 Tax=Trypanosoma grayi TaxID=71804 RepID=UPI0004F4BA08|nr:hypothetical protein DQ04_00741030 [Trypanosoma grayi]KEG13859.1 hypothetical protein DQ04_00741030 [Trypanosoma grayi]
MSAGPLNDGIVPRDASARSFSRSSSRALSSKSSSILLAANSSPLGRRFAGMSGNGSPIRGRRTPVCFFSDSDVGLCGSPVDEQQEEFRRIEELLQRMRGGKNDASRTAPAPFQEVT